MSKFLQSCATNESELRQGPKDAFLKLAPEKETAMPPLLVKSLAQIKDRYAFRAVSIIEHVSNKKADSEGVTSQSNTLTFRLIDSANDTLSLEDVGLDATTADEIKSLMKKPFGLFLVTGPTGSGKTTTLNAALNLPNPISLWIQTCENPVEFPHALRMQYPGSEGLSESESWAKLMKGLLRNAPNIALVGEVRDRESIEKALDLASTGHLVVATMHTNSAVGCIDRMRDLGIKNDKIVSTVRGIFAQRLVRKLCKHCRIPATDREEIFDTINSKGFKAVTESHVNNFNINKMPLPSIYTRSESGCFNCSYTGFRGRLPVHELLLINKEVGALIEKDETIKKIESTGIPVERRMLAVGFKKVLHGETCIVELLATTDV
jgi:type II secretory ATPase GspE/PulE/Tfp pilus assembly ATPase PilB-like protein